MNANQLMTETFTFPTCVDLESYGNMQKEKQTIAFRIYRFIGIALVFLHQKQKHEHRFKSDFILNQFNITCFDVFLFPDVNQIFFSFRSIQ